MEKKVIYGFDLLKFIMSLFVIAIHSHLADILISKDYQILGEVIKTLQDLAVPSFFVLSSYLFFKKSLQQSSQENVYWLKFVKRLCKVYFFYFLLLSPIITQTRGWFDVGIIMGLKLFLMDIFLRFTYPGSWFLSALIIATTIVFFLGKKINYWILLCTFFILYLYIYNVQSLPESYRLLYEWYENHIRNIQLSFPTALFWISMGAGFAKLNINGNLVQLAKYQYILWFCFIFIFLLTLTCGSILVNGLNNIFMVALLTILFYNMKLKPSSTYRVMREYSILFFFWHFIVLKIIDIIFNEQSFDLLGIWIYPITLIPVVLISTIILYLENKRYFKWLRYSH